MSTGKSMDLSKFNNTNFHRGAPKLKEVLWIIVSTFLFKNSLFVFNGFKVFILRLFGANIGIGVVIKPNINVKFPWKLSIGNNTWIGEEVWIDNLEEVTICDNVCISQGALLLCGNHDYTSTSFDLMVKEIKIESGAWIGAKSVVCPGVLIGSHAILTVGSVATKPLEAYSIYQGNPAVKIKERVFK